MGVPRITESLVATVVMAVALILTATPAMAHGMHYSLEEKDGVVIVSAAFSTGDPACYAALTVHAPGGEQEFQSGRTDANGCFAYVPDRTGAWTVEIDGGMGHRLHFTVEQGDAPSTPQTTVPGASELWIKAILGISMLFNAALALRWYQTKQPSAPASRTS